MTGTMETGKKAPESRKELMARMAERIELDFTSFGPGNGAATPVQYSQSYGLSEDGLHISPVSALVTYARSLENMNLHYRPVGDENLGWKPVDNAIAMLTMELVGGSQLEIGYESKNGSPADAQNTGEISDTVSEILMGNQETIARVNRLRNR
tara:strand:- start:48 stop:506 length:459 start_codon:yes stop_codon:yes gene_type:complete